MTNFKSVLRRKGYSGKTFAEAAGISQSIVYKYMCGARPISPKVAARFASILKVRPEELIGNAEE